MPVTAVPLEAPQAFPALRKPSPLRRVVQAQDDDQLTKLHDDFEVFRRTGKRAEAKITDERPPIKRNRSSDQSSYKPYSLSTILNPTEADERSANKKSLYLNPAVAKTPIKANSRSANRKSFCLNPPIANRLGSSELFPDRYIPQQSNPAPSKIPDLARDSVANNNDPPVATRDFAYPTFRPQMPLSEAWGPKLPTSSHSPKTSPRRAAARSNSSDVSSASSTESSRARKALDVRLSQDKSRVELNNGKSKASVGFTSTAGAIFRDFVNIFTPSGGKEMAEDVTRQLSQSPRRDGRSESEFLGEDAGDDRVGSSSKRPRENSVPLVSSRKQQKQRMIDNDAALRAISGNLGILPLPSEYHEGVAALSSREGAIEDDQELHGNPSPKSHYPSSSESRKSH